MNHYLAPWRSFRFARQVCGGYARHYADAQARYRAENNLPDPERPALSEVGVRVLNGGSSGLALPPHYEALVKRIGADVNERLSWSRNALFHPPATHLAERTDDMKAVRDGEILTMALKDALSIDGLEELCEQVLPQIERAIFGAYVLVDKVYVLRTLPGRHQEQSSWLWHYDEHPLEILKLLIYLTDVDEGTAPFTYLSSADGRAAMGTRMPLYGQSRISASRMALYFANAHQARPVIGPAGTAILFNDNVIHRATFATLATGRHRDALTLQLRPSLLRRRPYVDSRWTGTVGHRDFNRDPEQVAPQLP